MRVTSLAIGLFSALIAFTPVTVSLVDGFSVSQAVAAQSGSRSSNGYSRPSTPAPRLAPSAPTSGNGYTRPPSAPTTAAPAPATAAPSVAKPQAPPVTASPLTGSDAAISKQASARSLKSFTAQQEQASYAKQATAAPPPLNTAYRGYGGYYTNVNDWHASRASYYGGFGWQAPIYVFNSYPRFGIWDAMFMWFMLDTVSNANHALWFHNHYDDPGYREWRREADRLAQDNAELRTKLAALDERTRTLEGQPRDPTYLPPDAKPELVLSQEYAVAAPKPQSSGGGTWLWLVLGIGALGATYFFMTRRRAV